AFVEKQIGWLEIAPRRESSRLTAEEFSLFMVMNIGAGPAGAAPPIFFENLLQGFKLVRFGVEMREIRVAGFFFLGDLELHRRAIVAMKGVALDKGGLDLFAPEYLLED